jgi:branched-chain amino acid transport system permease protein
MLVNMGLTISMYGTLISGRLSLAPVGFMAVGAYTTAFLAIHKVPVPLAIAAGAALATLFALAFALVTLRLRAIYFTVATLGLVLVIQQVAGNLKSITGGYLGMTGIPMVVDQWPLLAYVGLAAFVYAAIRRSRIGRGLHAISVDDRIAASLGINVPKYLVISFVASSVVAAVGGGLYALTLPYIDPSFFGFGAMINLLAFAVLGGATHWIGPIVGAGILTLLPEFLRPLGQARDVFNGLIVILVIVFLPGGITDRASWRALWRRRRRTTPSGRGLIDASTSTTRTATKTGG